MAVFSMGTSATDKLFLEYIMPGLNTEIRTNTILYDRFKSRSDTVLGKYAVFKNITGSPKSARPSSSTTFPTAKQGTYDEYIIYMKRGMYASLQFDGLATACSQGKGAVMEILRAEVEGIEKHIANKLNRQFWGDGSGRLARIYGAVSNSTSVVVDNEYFGTDSNEYTSPATYLDEGMSVDIYNATGTLQAEDIEISSITWSAAATATLTMASAVTCDDNGYIFDHDTYASSQAAGTGVPMGLIGIVNTSNPYVGITSAYFQNIDRSATGKSWSQGTMVDMASAAITNAKLMKLIQEVEKWGRVAVLITNDIIWRAYYQILEADKTMPNDPAFWGGTTGITYYAGRSGKIPLIYDTDCPDGRVYALDEKPLAVHSPVRNGMAWLPGDNGILTRVQGKDENVANLVHYYNFGCEKTRAQGVLYGVKHAAS